MKFIKFIFFIIICFISLAVAFLVTTADKNNSSNIDSGSSSNDDDKPNNNLKFKIKFNLQTTITNILPKEMEYKEKYKTYGDVFSDSTSIDYLNLFFHYTPSTKILKDHIIYLFPKNDNTIVKIYRTSNEFTYKYFTDKKINEDLSKKIVGYYKRFDISISDIYLSIKKIFKSVYEKEFYKEALPLIIC